MHATEIPPRSIHVASCNFFVLMDYCGNIPNCLLLPPRSNISMLQFVMFVRLLQTFYYVKSDSYRLWGLIFLCGPTTDIVEEIDFLMRSGECDAENSGALLPAFQFNFSDGRGECVSHWCWYNDDPRVRRITCTYVYLFSGDAPDRLCHVHHFSGSFRNEKSDAGIQYRRLPLAVSSWVFTSAYKIASCRL